MSIYKYEWEKFKEKIVMLIAWRVPKRIAFWCFIRVHSLSGKGPDYNGDYKRAYDFCVEKWGLK